MRNTTSTIHGIENSLGWGCMTLSNIHGYVSFNSLVQDCSLNQGIWAYPKTLIVSASHPG